MGPFHLSGFLDDYQECDVLTGWQCCNFNQDFSCIAVGHKKGYTILNCDPFGKVHSKSELRGQYMAYGADLGR